MSSNITKRLVITNLLVLILALLCFYIVSVYSLNSQALEQSKQQIYAESRTIIERTENMNDVFRKLDIKDDFENSPNPYNPQGQDPFVSSGEGKGMSVHIFCKIGENGELLFPNDNSKFMNRIKLDEISKENISGLPLEKTEVLMIENERYLTLLSPYISQEGEDGILVSMLEMKTVTALTITNIIVFGLTFILLVIVSFFLIRIQSMKIINPLKTLTERSIKYANRDYSEDFTVNTRDEIESLSKSIQTMVESIIAHEKAQTSLFRNLSHELKTPLTAISGYAQNIQNGYYEDKNVPLKIIQEECKRIRDILDNLIFLSKIDSNVEDFKFEKFDVVKLLTKSVEKIESIAILEDIDIFYEPQNEIYISCDSEKIIRAFINILSNAIKHTKDYIKILVSEDSSNIYIKVIDNGKGFSEEKLGKLFFTSTGETIDGNGLGLMIVYEIIKKHSGNIIVKNNLENGAKVVISLPKIK